MEGTKEQLKNRLPLIPLRGEVGFPGMQIQFGIGRECVQKAMEAALEGDRHVVLATQRHPRQETPAASGIYKIGVVAKIQQIVHADDGSRAIAECLFRVKLSHVRMPEEETPSAICHKIQADAKDVSDETEVIAVIRALKEKYAQLCQLKNQMPALMVQRILQLEDMQELFNQIVDTLHVDYNGRQAMLEESNPLLRMTLLLVALTQEVEVTTIQQDLNQQTAHRIEVGQREFFLRTQQRIIAEELGDDEETLSEAIHYQREIMRLGLPDAETEKLLREAIRMERLSGSPQEAAVVRTYLDTVLALPWHTRTKKKVELQKAAALLEREHYGLKRVKERILEALSVYALKPDLKGQILCLVGPPGVGKTSIAHSVAAALGRSFVRVSLGGVYDESEIRGHRRTYVAAMPGRIMTAIQQAGTKNPLMLLDEIDKLGGSANHGDPSAAMLEVLDSEQNHAFKDHYLDVPFDLSEVVFLATANSLQTIPTPLLDRMEIIELNSYTREEKFHIAKQHLLKKELKQNGMRAGQIRITDAAYYDLIDYYTHEAGVRDLSRKLAALCRKAAKRIVEEGLKRVQYTPETLEQVLGPHKYRTTPLMGQSDAVGVVNGLAWTSVGGVLMPLEVLTMDGKGEMQLTGSLGDVMQESAKLARSYVRSVARQYDINPELFRSKDIHLHAPEGAVPKDGPSAGVTMVTALVSALSGIPVRHDVAMTGEITLHGRVLPIGGLVEKSMAAYQAGIHTVLIPEENVPDLEELDETVRNDMTFIPCATLETVLSTALAPPQYEAVLEPLNPMELERFEAGQGHVSVHSEQNLPMPNLTNGV